MARRPPESTPDLSALARRRGGKRRDEELIALKRRVQKLALLGAAPVVLAEGLHLVRIASVFDPAHVVKELKENGPLPRSLFQRVFGLLETPVLVDAAFLAAARREIKALSTAPALASAREHHRALARYGTVNAQWLAAKTARLDEIATWPRERATEAWFEAIIELVRARRGAEAAEALAEAGARIAGAPAERRDRARARIVELVASLPHGANALAELDLRLPPKDRGENEESASEVARLAERLDGARDLPGRARRRKILDILRTAVGWTDAPAELDEIEALALPMSEEELTRAIALAGKRLADSLPRRERKEAEDLLDFVAWVALLLPIDADGVPLPNEAQRTKLRASKDELVEMAERGVALAKAVALAELSLDRGVRRTVAKWVAQGLEIDLVVQGAKDGHLGPACRVPDLRAARAYLTWASRLAAHYKGLGITFSLSPELFQNLPRDEDLAVLAICLMEHAREPEAGGRGDPIGVLDATLGLFQRLPTKARGILGRLRTVEEGAGRRAFPDVAEWLDRDRKDDALLDRYVHVLRLTGEPVVLTKRMREDFEHASKSARERAHLEKMKTRSIRQEGRLAVLRRGDRSLESAPRGRTRRRIQARIEALLPVAYKKELDAAFREILREAWGIAVPSLTPAWRDAVRFWLVVEDNRELLGQLLRRAAELPGRCPKRSFPKNVAWIEKARASIDVDAWMAPRAGKIVGPAETYDIALEEDPLEVLRMGIPFGTCLALETGVNAASTVLNAIDANKRVIYVRRQGDHGAVVARLLIALTKELRIVGYNLYVSTRGPDEKAIRAHVLSMVRALAHDVGTPLSAAGQPDKIHDGFWYDDGTVPFEGDVDVEAYCRSLGITLPETPPAPLAQEARGWAAMEAGDEVGVSSSLSAWDSSPSNVALGRWLVDRLGARELERRAQEGELPAFIALLRSCADAGEDGMMRGLELATRVPESLTHHRLDRYLARFPASLRLTNAIVEMGERAAKRAFGGDHGLAHRTMSEIPRRLLDVASSFDTLDRTAYVWKHVTDNEPRCSYCARDAAIVAADELDSLFTHRPDDAAVVACLASRHRSLLAHQAALRVASRHVLHGGERALSRFFTLRPELSTSPTALAAMLRQTRADRMTRTLLKRLPIPEWAPFEELGDLLFTCEGMELLVGTTPRPTDLDQWMPGPWELAWMRRKAAPSVARGLFEIASRAPGEPTRARELLALLADVDALRDLKERASVSHPPEPSSGTPADAREIKSEHREIALMLSAQVRAHARGRLAKSISRVRWADAAYAELARTTLLRGALDDPDRETAREIVLAHGNGIDEWALHRLLRVLVARRDDASAKALLDGRVGKLAPEVVAELWQRPALQTAYVENVARKIDEDWAARVWAVERAAAARGVSADELLERLALTFLAQGEPSLATDAETTDQLRSIIGHVVREATPEQAVAFYAELDDAFSAALYLKAVVRLPFERAAALRDAVPKVTFAGEMRDALKAWLLATRGSRRITATLQDAGASSIERG